MYVYVYVCRCRYVCSCDVAHKLIANAAARVSWTYSPASKLLSLVSLVLSRISLVSFYTQGSTDTAHTTKHTQQTKPLTLGGGLLLLEETPLHVTQLIISNQSSVVSSRASALRAGAVLAVLWTSLIPSPPDRIVSKPVSGNVTDREQNPHPVGASSGDSTTRLKRSAVISVTGIHR